MKSASTKVRPDEYILAALSPEERLDAALRIAREAFRKANLSLEEVEAAIRKVRRSRYRKREAQGAGRR